MTAFFQNRFVRGVLLPVAVLWALGWTYYQLVYPPCTFRYKLTAEVMTPNGLKSGSSVWEVSYSHNGDWGGGATPKLKMMGEALYLNLSGDKNLFVLLSNRTTDHADGISSSGHDYTDDSSSLNAYSLPLKAFGLVWDFKQTGKLCTELKGIDSTRSFPVPLTNLPTLVTFRKLNDPNSVEIVKPEISEDSLGPGYRLSSATVARTDTKVTTGIGRILEWLAGMEPKDTSAIWGKTDPLIDQLQYLSFKQ